MERRRRFTKEFKMQLMRESEHRSAAVICREHEIHPTLLARWKSEHKKDPENAFSGNGNLYKEDARIAKYERLIGQLYTENALLKKSIAYNERLIAEEKKKRRSLK